MIRSTCSTRDTARRAVLAAVAACAPLCAPALAEDSWQDLGCADPGIAGDPVLSGTGSLQLGAAASLDLAAAAPSSAALLFVGFDPVALPFKGGTLKALPLFSIPFTTTGAGTIPLPFTWPLDLPEGTQMTFQYAIADGAASQGVALSNALLGTAGPPCLSIDAFGPSSGGVGTSVTLSGAGFLEDELDYCVQIRDDAGNVVGFARATGTSPDSLELELTAAISTIPDGTIVVTPGEGQAFVPSSVPPGMQLLEDVWLWSGDMADAVEAPGSFTFTSSGDGGDSAGDSGGGTCHYYFAGINGAGALEMVFPSSGTPCPVGTAFTMQLELSSSLGTIAPFDYGACLENTLPLSAVDCASKLCQVFQQAFFEAYGVFLSCSVQVSGSEVKIVVEPPLGETWGGYGYIKVCAPDLEPCEDEFGGLEGSGMIELSISCPPAGGVATYYLEGATDLTPYFAAFDTFVVPPALTDSQCATLWCDEITDAILDQSGIVVTCVDLGGGEIGILPPGSEVWTYAFMQAAVCPTP